MLGSQTLVGGPDMILEVLKVVLTGVETHKLAVRFDCECDFPRPLTSYLVPSNSPALTVSPPPVCHLSEGPQKMRARRKWVPPSPTLPILHPAPAARSRRLKPEPQEAVLRSILSGQTNYSPFDKRALFILYFLYSHPI